MAKYALSGSEDVGTIAVIDPNGGSIPDLDLGLAKADGDYLDQLDQMSRQMDRADTIVDTTPAVIELDDLLDRVVTLRVPLEEARRLINEKKYEEALERLCGLLTAPGEPHEAAYLIGLCHYHLGQPEEALEALQPLLGAVLEEGISRPLKQLKHQIREQILTIVVVENLLLVRKGQSEKPIERLRRLTRLDPQFGLFHFLLAGNLMMADRLEEALDAAENGVQESDAQHRKKLEGIKESIVQRLLEVKMEKARAYYRKRKYAKARSALERLDARYQQSPLWITFHEYLEQLVGGVLSRNRKPQDVKPSGSFQEVDALHFFLARSDIAHAKLAISMGLLDPAMRVLELALSHTPHFPYLHFLTAHCIYQRTGQSLKSDSPPGPDDVLEILSKALIHAKRGATDNEISSAQELQDAIESAIDAMHSVKKELKIRRQEVDKVNAVIEEFKAVMELVGDGISSLEHWREVCKEMGKVKRRIGSVRAKIVRSEGQQALDQLERVVDNNVEQLDALETVIKQAETIKEAMEELTDVMSSAEGGISSIDDAKRLERRLAKLSTRVKTLLKSVVGEDAKEALVKLQEAVDRNHSQILDILSHPPKPPDEVREFNELAREFQALMESIQGGKIGSRSELDEFKSKLVDIAMRVAKLKGKMTDRQGTEATEQLMQAIINVFSQLPA